jgi:uncharacterized protein YaaQ
MIAPGEIDLLMIVSVVEDQAGELSQQLVQNGFYFTRVDSKGGLLELSTVSLLIGIPSTRREKLMQIVRSCCSTRRTFIPARAESPLLQGQPLMIEAEVGGAVVSILEVDHFEQI